MKIYELKLTELDSAGVTAISFVERPAIESDFIFFSKANEENKELIQFKAIDEDKQIVAGAAMIPDKQIFRNDGNEDYFVYFTEPTIRQVAQKFFLDGKINSTTLEHEETLNGVSVVESWIIEDSKADKSALYGFDLPVGTWFIMMKVNNPQVWQQIKEGSIKGFSVEGIFTNQLIKNSEQMNFDKMKDEILDAIGKMLTKPDKDPDKTGDNDAEKFGSVAAVSVADASEILISYPGETLEAGAAITYDVDGEALPVPTGEYALPGDMVLIVAEDGIAGEIKAAEPGEELDKDINAEEIIAKVGELLTDALALHNSQVEARLEEKLNLFRAEFNKPGADPEVHKPGDKNEPQVVKSLSQKIRDSKTD